MNLTYLTAPEKGLLYIGVKISLLHGRHAMVQIELEVFSIWHKFWSKANLYVDNF